MGGGAKSTTNLCPTFNCLQKFLVFFCKKKTKNQKKQYKNKKQKHPPPKRNMGGGGDKSPAPPPMVYMEKYTYLYESTELIKGKKESSQGIVLFVFIPPLILLFMIMIHEIIYHC